jgi:L-aspartate oxidase
MTLAEARAALAVAPLRRLPLVVPQWEARADVVVVGAGAAGLSTARVAGQAGRDVLVLVKGALGTGATAFAQGGLAAVQQDDDSPALHGLDTTVAGAGLCAVEAVTDLVRSAPGELRELVTLGAHFDSGGRQNGRTSYALTREGGHSRDRVVHAGGDASGAEVDRVLRRQLPRTVRVLEEVTLLEVLTDGDGSAVGVLAGLVSADGTLVPGLIRSRAVVLATGGFGQAWSTTTSPSGLTGDGLAAAVRAGAVVQDVEFVQFHPTVLWSGAEARGQQPLLTEALRGEGAVLVDGAGDRVMLGVHPLADLAPRDVVSAAMLAHMRRQRGARHLWLDATGLGRETLEKRFPTVVAACRAHGVDPVRQPVPVAPGVHYTCGGVAADLSGRTSLRGLYAVGEVAATGVHGANRLASNSLTEALLAGRRCGQLLARELPRGGEPYELEVGSGVAAAARSPLAMGMSRDVGVSRDEAGLTRMLEALRRVGGSDAVRRRTPLTVAEAEATSLQTVSTLVALAAATRTESRGCHRRADYPETVDAWRRRVMLRSEGDVVVAHGGPRVDE